jgi:DNA-directed RNA polymerase specialized sigma24 family protein
MSDALNLDSLSTQCEDPDEKPGGENTPVLGADFDAFCEQTKIGALALARTCARHNLPLADDAFQEAYLRMMTRWPHRRNEPFTANRNYLLKIVVRETSRLRQRARRSHYWPRGARSRPARRLTLQRRSPATQCSEGF